MKTAVVLMNLGTPTEPTKKAVRAFLKEFLSDRRVVEIPKLVWMVILYLVILTFRTPRVTKAYQKIWSGGESPLRSITRLQTVALQKKFDQQFLPAKRPSAHYAMAYSGPSLEEQVQQLEEDGVEHILILPLYPQYSATTTGSVYDQVTNIVSKRRNIPQIHIIKQYFDDSLYIEALVESIKQQWNVTGKPDRLLMSFHSIPQRYVDAGDPYYQQCLGTAQLVVEVLGLTDEQWAISFQSRLGFAKWLSPYTSDTLKSWGENKVKHVDVICPAFAADCLETLEEIEVENRALFLNAGGEVFNVIPCLNDSSDHIEMMFSIVNRYLPQSN